MIEIRISIKLKNATVKLNYNKKWFAVKTSINQAIKQSADSVKEQNEQEEQWGREQKSVVICCQVSARDAV